MSVATDMADSWRYVEGVEEVAVTPQNPTATAVTGVKAKRRVLKASRVYMLGATIGLTGKEITIHLWKDVLGATVPKVGDKITDASAVVYSIISVDLESLGQRYRTICLPDL